MPRRQLTQLLISAVMCAAFCSGSFAQDCKNSGAAAWNESVRYVAPGCAAEFPSPNKRLLLKFASDGAMSIKGMTTHLIEGLSVPSVMVSWSPRSDAFFINDGEGSGMTSNFRLFRIKGTRVYEDKRVERVAVSLYRRRTGCSPSALDPNVWGFGWSEGGSKLYLLVQATVHEPCGDTDKFVSLIIRSSDGKVLEALSNTQTKVRFGSQLPSSLFGK